VQGNIDLTQRPRYRNPDGSISTVHSKSWNFGRGEVLLPTVAEDGSHIMSDDEAKQQYRETGRHLGIFDTPGHATDYANNYLHQDQAQWFGPEEVGLPSRYGAL
jgi:hypothetical protein